jgi:Uma2 family endonuclease
MSYHAKLERMAVPVLEHMAVSVVEHPRPWTEEEFFALGETANRVELFDGSLLVSPAPTVRHQRLSRRLANVLEPAAREAGLDVHLAINLRLRPGRVPIPDLVIARPVDPDTLVIEARDIELVCEITSTNAATDRVLKMHYYSAAGIPWYLLVDPQGPTLNLFRLDGDKYVEEASAAPGERLLFTAPIVTELDPASLAE